MRSYRLHFIRHAATMGNRLHQFIGKTDDPATPEGLATILGYREDGLYPSVSKVYVSPLSRCQSTAEAIYPLVNTQIVPGLSEYDFGDFEGKTVESLGNSPELAAFMRTKNPAAPPGGESLTAFSTRITGALDLIIRNMMEQGLSQAAVITHGGVISTLLAAHALPRQHLAHWLMENGCGYTAIAQANFWGQERVIEVLEKISPDGFSTPTDIEAYLDYAESLVEESDLIP